MLSLGENMGLNDDKNKTNEEPHNQELKMLLELLKTGSNEEQRMLAQALLDIEQRQALKSDLSMFLWTGRFYCLQSPIKVSRVFLLAIRTIDSTLYPTHV